MSPFNNNGADPTIISLALLPMPLALKPLSGPTHDQTLRPSEQHLCFLSKSLGGAFQGFNVMFLWDKGGFKVYVNKEAIKEESKG